MIKNVSTVVRFSLLIFIGLTAFGCATNTGVIPTGEDSWLVSRQAGNGFVGAGTIKAEAFQEATEFCSRKGKSLQVTSVKEAEPPFINGNWYKAEISFMCLAQGDRELTRPRLQPQPDTVIEIRTETNREKNSATDLYAELIKLDDLLKKGIINKEEFQNLKEKLLSN